MSTATAFKSIGYFPFCPVPAHSSGTSYVGGLTLAQAMAFFWNLETVTFTFAGTLVVTATSGGGAVPAGTVYSTGFTGNATPTTNGTTGDLTGFDSKSTSGSIAVVPNHRVCKSNVVIFISWDKASEPSFNLDMDFRLVVDPSDSTKFAIDYFFSGGRKSATAFSASATISITDPSFVGSGTVFGSGSFTIAGISFNYDFSWTYTYPTHATVVTTGGTMSATSGSYTY